MVVNNVAVNNTTIINVTNITYNNTHVDNAVVATTHEHFGNGHVHDAPVHVTRPQELEHVHGALPVKPGPTSLVAGAHAGTRPPESVLSRPVVATRPPRESRLPWRVTATKPEKKTAAEQRYLLVPKHPSKDMSRPEFGAQTGEERLRPALPPRFEERRRAAEPAGTDQSVPRVSRTTPPETPPQRIMRETALPPVVQERGRLTPEPRRSEAAPAAPRASAPREIRQRQQVDRSNLPGKPANRVYRIKDKDKEKGERQRSQHKPE